jgi:phospholipid transport system substrate-binding protein
MIRRSRLAMFATAAALALALALVAGAGVARAEESAATRSVRVANETMSKLLRATSKPGSAAEKKRAGKVTSQLRGFLDVDELGKLALVDHWDGLSEDQRTEYSTLLRNLIEANYIKGLRANLDYKVKYLGERKRGDSVVVETEIATKKNKRTLTISIEYVLRPDGKTYRAVDVVTDGVGLVENYRAQFNRIISKEGFEGLLKRMRGKLEAISS